MKINAVWHKAHKMPKNPTLDQRLDWHAAHVRHCGCRNLTPKLREAFEKRKIKI